MNRVLVTPSGFHFDRLISTMSVTDTRYGITSKHLLLGIFPGQILTVNELSETNEKVVQKLAFEGLTINPTKVLNYDKIIFDLTEIQSIPTNLGTYFEKLKPFFFFFQSNQPTFF